METEWQLELWGGSMPLCRACISNGSLKECMTLKKLLKFGVNCIAIEKILQQLNSMILEG